MLNNMVSIVNVGTNTEMRYTANGTPVTSFRLAVGHKYKTSGSWHIEVERRASCEGAWHLLRTRGEWTLGAPSIPWPQLRKIRHPSKPVSRILRKVP